VLHGVGDLLGRACEGAVPAAAAETPDQLTNGEPLSSRQGDHPGVAALGALDGIFIRQILGQLCVEIEILLFPA
jgi:hypothetical protein